MYEKYKLLDWIDSNKLYWHALSLNDNAIDLLRENPEKINWSYLSLNTNAIELLRENPEKINWNWLSINPNAIDLLHENPERIDWNWSSINPNAIDLLREKPDQIFWPVSQDPIRNNILREISGLINWSRLSRNPSLFYKSFDYDKIKSRCDIYREEFIQFFWNPKRVMFYLTTYYGGDIDLYFSFYD